MDYCKECAHKEEFCDECYVKEQERIAKVNRKWDELYAKTNKHKIFKLKDIIIMSTVFPKESRNMLTGNYLKLSKLEEGEETRIRILGNGVYGWEDWTTEMKPVRFRSNDKPIDSINPDKPMKEFLAFIVWNYETETIQILHLTQKKVMKSLKALEEKKGVLTNYDIRIIRSGEGKLSQYTLLPGSANEIPFDAKEALQFRPVDLEALYEGKDPFSVGKSILEPKKGIPVDSYWEADESRQIKVKAS